MPLSLNLLQELKFKSKCFSYGRVSKNFPSSTKLLFPSPFDPANEIFKLSTCLQSQKATKILPKPFSVIDWQLEKISSKCFKFFNYFRHFGSTLKLSKFIPYKWLNLIFRYLIFVISLSSLKTPAAVYSLTDKHPSKSIFKLFNFFNVLIGFIILWIAC